VRLPRKAEVVSVIAMAGLYGWSVWIGRYTQQTYLFDTYLYKLIIVTIASVAGLFVAWRVFMRGKPVGQKNTWLFSVFFGVAGFLVFVFWNVPEAIMVANAHQTVSDNYKFRMVYPGPSCGKHCTCKAGVIYYDTFLKREIEFCQNDHSSFFYTDYMRVDKLISEKGGRLAP
jgi:hypothetical protein